LPRSSERARRHRTFILTAVILLALPVAAQQGRLASDFEIAQMERQLERSRGFEAQISGRLNLGDARAGRNETALARSEYAKALEIASSERLSSRRDADVTRYATATSYAALAAAKLGRDGEAFILLEESIRYLSDDPETWNIYSSTMRILRYPRKAASAARNAVAIASVNPSSVARRLDLAVYQYSLAMALVESGEDREAEEILLAITTALRSREFAALGREVARQESFEVYSSARGDVAAYVSLLNRAQLRLATLYEWRGDVARAREQYQLVLEGRSDDATALGGLARLAESDRERQRRYEEAFEANPFSLPLIREYQQQLASGRLAAVSIAGSTPGARMRAALVQLSRGERRAARETLDSLALSFPQNDAIRLLMREADSGPSPVLPSADPTPAELRALIGAFDALTPEQRATLDQATFASEVTFDRAEQEPDAENQALFESGTIGDIPFRFSGPVRFAGRFEAAQPLRLTYRILGVTRSGDAWALLLEPIRVEVAR
jgi:hypothetical protein